MENGLFEDLAIFTLSFMITSAISYLMGDTNVSLGLPCGALFLALAGIISACAESHTEH